MKRVFTISGLMLLCIFSVNSAFAQNVTVKGKITDAATNETLIGVSVTIKGTTVGTQTDVMGAYRKYRYLHQSIICKRQDGLALSKEKLQPR
jgi:hypothetical protein